MPDRENSRRWAERVVWNKLTDDQIEAIRLFHQCALHEEDATVTPKLKPAARQHFVKLAKDSLTPEQILALTQAHMTLPGHTFR